MKKGQNAALIPSLLNGYSRGVVFPSFLLSKLEAHTGCQVEDTELTTTTSATLNFDNSKRHYTVDDQQM